MFRKCLLLVASLSVAAFLSGCGADDDADVTDSSTSGANDDSSESVGGSEEDASEQGTIVESGFGQVGQYAWVTALVRNESDHGGQTVTVNFNLLDKSGELVASGSQVASFSWAGQEVPIATQVDVGPRVEAATMEATVLVEDEGTFEEHDPTGWESEIQGTLYRPQYSDEWGAKFTITNPGDEPLDGSAVQVICHDEAGNVIGGTSEYPELIPPSGQVLVDAISVYSKTKPADCLGYHIPWL
jgi:hypothetical protein